MEYKYKEDMAARSKYVDELKFDVTADKFKDRQPFWTHYMWTGGRYAGRQGQFRFMWSWNMKQPFDQWRKDARAYLRANHEITFTLSTGHFPKRQFLVSSQPMDHKSTQSILGWFMRVRFLPVPKQTDQAVGYIIHYMNVDDKKSVETKKYPAADYKKAMRDMGQIRLLGKGRVAGIMVDAYGLLKKFFTTSNRHGADARHHPSDVMFGQWAQANGMYKNYMLSNRAIQVYTMTEWSRVIRSVSNYKAAYKRRMQSQARTVYSWRSQLMKKSKLILLDKTYMFAIPMSWSTYDRNKREHIVRTHQNQYINYNRLDYPLKRYYDWILWRTNWFMKDWNQHVGPEYALVGNNRFLMTTAPKSMAKQRQSMIGISNWVNRFQFKVPRNQGVFITGTIDGKIKATNCPNIGACKKMYLDQQNSGVYWVPYAVFQGQRRIWARGCTGGAYWNGIQLNFETLTNMIGQYQMQMNSANRVQGYTFKWSSTGMKIRKLMKKSYYFYATQNDNDHQKRYIRAWGYYTNDLDRVLAWYKNPAQFWNKGGRTTALWFRDSKAFLQLVAYGGKNNYVYKAINIGYMNYAVSPYLDPNCFSKFIQGSNDFAIYQVPGQHTTYTRYPGHTSKNYYAWLNYARSKKLNSILYYVVHYHGKRTLRRWNKYDSPTKFNAGVGAYEAAGRFLLQHCPHKYSRAKATYHELGVEMK